MTEQNLTERLERAAQATDVGPPPLHEMLAHAHTRRRHRNMLLAATASVAAVAFVLGATALTGPGISPTGDPASVVSGSSAPTSSPSVVALTDSDLLGRWNDDPDSTQEQPFRRPWLRFESGGKLTGFDGCNQVVGTWELDPNALKVSANVQLLTYVGCPNLQKPEFEELIFDGTGLVYKLPSGKARTLLAVSETSS